MILSNTKILWIMQIIIKLTCSISLSSNNFLYSFFTYIKMSKDSSANYYENNKERLQKSLSNEEKEKEQQYGCERYKNLTQDEKKSFSSIEKNIIKWEKMHYFNYKQLF